MLLQCGREQLKAVNTRRKRIIGAILEADCQKGPCTLRSIETIGLTLETLTL